MAKTASLGGGQAGIALFYAYLANALSSEEHSEQSLRCLEWAIEALEAVPMKPSLFRGFTGVGWSTAHLERLLSGSAEADAGDDLIPVLKEYLEQSPWEADFDLIDGLVGFGVYALERLPKPQAFECLELAVDRLEEISERAAEGVTWFTPLHRDSRGSGQRRGYYNLGVAHGVPGVIAFLARAWAAGARRDKAEGLLADAVPWLLAQRQLQGPSPIFPRYVGPGLLPGAGRLAWCYGDPGIAASLLGAARLLGVEPWEREAIAIALAASERGPGQVEVSDACLCHGTAGLGHLFNRLYQATGEARFREAARNWFEKALAQRRPGQGIAGFSALDNLPSGEQIWVDEAGFLMGAAGIGLALLAAIAPFEPRWDSILLVSIPPDNSCR